MSVQLTDLQTVYYVFANQPETLKNFLIPIYWNPKFKFWGIETTETNYKEIVEPCKNFYESAQEALETVQKWAEAHNYKLSSHP